MRNTFKKPAIRTFGFLARIKSNYCFCDEISFFCLLNILIIFPFDKCFSQNDGDDFFNSSQIHTVNIYFNQTAYWDSLTQNYLTDEYMTANVDIDSLADAIRTDVYADSNKMFSNQNFEDNINTDINVSGTPGGSWIPGLKTFIENRRNYINNELVNFGYTPVNIQENWGNNYHIITYPNPTAKSLYNPYFIV